MSATDTAFSELRIIYPHGISIQGIRRRLEGLDYSLMKVIGIKKYDPRDSYRPRFEDWIQDTQPALVPYLAQQTESGDYTSPPLQGFWDCWIKALGKAHQPAS